MRYRAFISYSHADQAWARWLIRRLETYRVPALLVGKPGAHGPIPARLGAFFRDRDELTASSDLGATIREALSESEFLIVVCSPAAAGSRWVDAEVQAFRDSGRADRVLAFVVDGDPGQTGAAGCFPPALVAPDASGKALEPLAADARRDADGRSRAFLKLVSSLLGIRFDQLARRDAQRKQRKLLLVAAASLAGMAFAIGLAITAYVARNDAQRRQAQAEDIVGFMLGDLRKKLTTVGRLDLMRTVDDKATSYFATLNPRDLSDRTLAEQARSLTGIGEVRLSEGNHDEAMTAFREAHARSTALYQRAPRDGQRLFDLAQAEYWIGYVAWQQGRLDDAGKWLAKYRDSAIKLAAMDRSNFSWQREVAYGHHNLAVLDESLGNYAKAERAMREEISLYRKWSKQHPEDTNIRFESANVASWLGTLMMRTGRLKDAQAFFVEEASNHQLNITAAPNEPAWKERMASSLLLLTESQALQARTKEASVSAERACRIASGLASHDPSNNDWRTALGVCRWWQARLADDSTTSRAAERVNEATKLLSLSHTTDLKNERILKWLVRAHLLQAELALEQKDASRAGQHVSAALAVIEPAWRSGRTESLTLWMGLTRLAQGDVANQRSESRAALSAWNEAHRLLLEGTQGTASFERNEPLARVLIALGRPEEAAIHRKRLGDAGYVPLRPWPDAGQNGSTQDLFASSR